MAVVGLTGGVAAGKSLVSAELERLGAHVIDADLISKEIFAPGTAEFKEAVLAFGSAILAKDGTINRKLLGAMVFADAAKLRLLNSITHPSILRRIRDEVASLKGRGEGVVVVDAALVMETGLDKEIDAVVVVYAPPEAQLDRLMKRDGLSREQALQRIDAQMPMEEKVKRAQFVIDNSGEAADALASVKDLYGKLKTGAYVKKRG